MLCPCSFPYFLFRSARNLVNIPTVPLSTLTTLSTQALSQFEHGRCFIITVFRDRCLPSLLNEPLPEAPEFGDVLDDVLPLRSLLIVRFTTRPNHYVFILCHSAYLFHSVSRMFPSSLKFTLLISIVREPPDLLFLFFRFGLMRINQPIFTTLVGFRCSVDESNITQFKASCYGLSGVSTATLQTRFTSRTLRTLKLLSACVVPSK